MKLLMTGAFNCTVEQKVNIENLGCEILFHKMENEPLNAEMFEAEGIICNGLFLYNDIESFPNLRFIQLTSAGLDRVPVEKINEKGIVLKNARGVYSVPMAEFAVSGVLALYKNIGTFIENQKNHSWIKDRNVREMSGDTVLVVGCGSVGTECAKRFKAFGMNVIGADIINPQNDVYDQYCSMDDMNSVLNKADVIVLTLPLTEETKNFFNGERFSCVKDGSILVNIARGAVVNEDSLVENLKNGKLSGAVLDVFCTEPLNENSELWDMKNVIITPHNSFVSPKNQNRMFDVAYDNIKEYMKG
jgi:phosphoglycerate dehydrogenase-like enzyme